MENNYRVQTEEDEYEFGVQAEEKRELEKRLKGVVLERIVKRLCMNRKEFYEKMKRMV